MVSRAGRVRLHHEAPPGKSQTHVDGLSRLRVDPPSPEDASLRVRLLEDEDEARKIIHELHTATHLGGHALRKLYLYGYFHKADRRICFKGVDREKSAVFKELTQNFRTYELRGQAKKKKKKKF